MIFLCFSVYKKIQYLEKKISIRLVILLQLGLLFVYTIKYYFELLNKHCNDKTVWACWTFTNK